MINNEPVGKEVSEWITRGKLNNQPPDPESIKYYSVPPHLEELHENLWQSLRDSIKGKTSSNN